MKRNDYFKRILCGSLCALMIAGVIACAPEQTTKQEDTTAVTDTEEEAERVWLDSLEEHNFNGATINVFSASDTIWVIPDDATTKEVVSESKIREINNVMERFDVKFNCPVYDDAGINGYFASHIRKVCESGVTDEIDYVSAGGHWTAPVALEGYMVNMAKTNEFKAYIDLEKPYWSDVFIENLNIRDQYFWIAGYTWEGEIVSNDAIYVNLDLVQVLNGEDFSIYDVVRNGEWTLDKFYEMSKNAYKDDGNGARDLNDQYGFTMNHNSWIDHLAICAKADYTKLDADNVPYLNVETERNVNIGEKLYDIVHSDGFLTNEEWNGGEVVYKFMNGQLLFYLTSVQDATKFRDLTWDFTMIPLPKYNSDQDNYYNFITAAVDGIPVVTPEDRYEMIFVCAEAVAAEVYRLVRPAWLDSALKNKYSRDDDTKEMIDLLQGHNTTDFLIVYGLETQVDQLFQNCYSTQDLSSILKRRTKPFKHVLDSMIESFDNEAEKFE